MTGKTAEASLVIIVFVASMASFVIARFRFKLQSLLLLFFVSGMMIPMQSVIIPLAFNLGQFHLKNNYLVLILIYVAFQLPMSVFIYNGFMVGIPKELEEAARVDGCSVPRIYWIIKLVEGLPKLLRGKLEGLMFSESELLRVFREGLV